MSDIIVQHGLPEGLQTQAAGLYFEAFQQKLQPIMGNAEIIIPLLANHFAVNKAFVAIQQGKLVGILGVHHEGGSFVNIPYTTIRKQFGWLSGTFKYGLLALLSRPSIKGELLLDGIAVDGTMRGKGIGTRLLEAAFTFARGQHYTTIRLDVIDTNPLAKRLYERVGFVATKVQHTPYLQHFMGFSAVTTMIKQLS